MRTTRTNPRATYADVEQEEMDADKDEPTQTVRNNPVQNTPDRPPLQPNIGNTQEPPQTHVTKTVKCKNWSHKGTQRYLIRFGE